VPPRDFTNNFADQLEIVDEFIALVTVIRDGLTGHMSALDIESGRLRHLVPHAGPHAFRRFIHALHRTADGVIHALQEAQRAIPPATPHPCGLSRAAGGATASDPGWHWFPSPPILPAPPSFNQTVDFCKCAVHIQLHG